MPSPHPPPVHRLPWTRRDAVLVLLVAGGLPLAELLKLRSPPSDGAVALPSISGLLTVLLLPLAFTVALCVCRMLESRTPFASLITTGATPWHRATRRGVMDGILVVLPILFLMVGTAVFLRYLGIEPEPQAALLWLRDANAPPTLIGLLIVQIVIIAPVTEEILYRGILVSVLLRNASKWSALFLSSLFFGALHGNLAAFPALTLLGIYFAYGFMATGSLITPIAMHAFFNAINVVLIVLG